MAAVANERSERVLDMIFTPIDRENWSRKEYFDHYFKEVPCTYSITTKPVSYTHLDVYKRQA